MTGKAVNELATSVGVSIGEAGGARHVAVVREPTTGSTLRTKGRLFLLVDVAGASAHAREVATEAAEVLRDEYYYDLSGGIEVSLRRAIVAANRRAHAKLRPGESLHAACAILCRNEIYTAKVGEGEVFLVRRARLFVPGGAPGELADYAHRVATRGTAPSLGSDSALVVAIWREQALPGDALVLTAARLIDALGPDELKTTILTLHPHAAAPELRDRFAASSGGRAAPGILVVEVAPLSAAPRVQPQAAAVEDPEVERITERLRARVDDEGARWPGLVSRLRRAAWLVLRPFATAVAVAIALVPRRRAGLPRAREVAAIRALRRRRVTVLLAVALLAASGGVGLLAYNDVQEGRLSGNANLALLRARQEVDAARTAASQKPADVTSARVHLEAADRFLDEAASSRRADASRLAQMRSEIAALRAQLTNVLVDLAGLDPKAAPVGLDYASKDVLYVADPGAAKVWRVPSQDPRSAAALAGRGSAEGLGVPALVSTTGDIVYVIDREGRLFRYEGSAKREITIKDRKFTQPVGFAVFSQNLYVLDRPTGQVWKYEPTNDGQYSAPAIPYLEKPYPADSVRDLAVDGDIWIVTDGGRLDRFRRQTGAAASLLEFAIRWHGEAAHVDAVQAKEGAGREIWVLDAKARRVVGIAKDGAEDVRVALPAELPEPVNFVAVEELNFVVSLHGTRLARTDIAR